MNIFTVRDNLIRTIAGKELLLDSYRNPSVNPYNEGVKEVIIQMLATNIDDLRAVLNDVQACCNEIAARKD